MHRNCKCEKSRLGEDQRVYLKKLGLSREATRLYDLLLVLGRLTAQIAATHTHNFPAAHYRLFYELEGHQLVRRHSGRPRSWSALSLKVGLQSSFKDSEAELKTLLQNSLGHSADGDNTRIITGRQAVYDVYAQYAAQAKKEVLIYSIGIAYSDILESTQRSLVKRGVRVRHVIQSYQPANYYIARKWVRAGVRVRHLPKEQGFHFFIIDNTQVCVTFTNSQDVEDRLSVFTDNKAAIQMFLRQFEDLWVQASKVDA